MHEQSVPHRFQTRVVIFRAVAALLLAGALVHVSTVWPRVITLTSRLDEFPAVAWIAAGGFVVSALTALLACTLAVLLLWKAAERADARALVLFLAFLAIFWGSLFRFLNVGIDQGGASTSVSVSLSYGGSWVSDSALMAVVMAAAAFVRFSALFPRPLTGDSLELARWFRRLRSIRIAFLRAPVVWGSALGALLVVKVVPDAVAQLLGPSIGPERGNGFFMTAPLSALLTFVILPLGALLFGTHNLRSSYRIASDDGRRRILWVVSGFSTASWMVLCAAGLLGAMLTLDVELGAFEALGAAIPLALFLAPFTVVVCAAIGILWSGALDPALVLQRSTVYGALGAFGVVAFAGLESALSAWVEERLGLPGFTGSMLAGATVAAALIPVRGPLKRVVVRYARRIADFDGAPGHGAPTRPDAVPRTYDSALE